MTTPSGSGRHEKWFERFDAYSVGCPTCQSPSGQGCTGGFGGGYSIHSDRVYLAASTATRTAQNPPSPATSGADDA